VIPGYLGGEGILAMTKATKQESAFFGPKETQQRLQAALRGAFSGPPTPLKDIPKRNGESRANGHRKKPKASRASAKTA
jgi:hypothetical protein